MESYLDVSACRGYRREDFPAESWAWDGDCIRALAHGPRVDLISKRSFGDFDLSLEWRLPVGGNSGLLYRVVESADAAWQSGPEMQLVDNRARVLTCDLVSEDFLQRVAHPKFRAFPQFPRAAEGHLVLQHHGSDAWFRDIRIGVPIGD